MGANVSTLAPDAKSLHFGEGSQDSLSTSTITITSSSELPVHSVGLFFSKENRLSKLKQKIKTKFDLKKRSNHGQVFREFSNHLSLRDLSQVFEEYKSTFFLKELFLYAESARPIASNLRNDLSELYDYKYNSDVTLLYKGVDFPVHKAIVCVRCPYFRELLRKKQTGSVVQVNLDIKGLRVELFNDLLKYLYTGELAGSYDSSSNTASYQALIRISQECGVPNPLLHDLKYLLDTGLYSDACLCFQTDTIKLNNLSNNQADRQSSEPIKCTCCTQSEFSCHQAILVARSPFFKSAISRQQQRRASLKRDSPLDDRMKIVLDESIIPRRFARIILHVMYRDADNLMSLIQTSVCKCSASCETAKNSNQNIKESQQTISLVKEIMSLYEIARFLEIDYLVQSCEDLIIELLSIDTLILILKWSEQPHGSPWVKRQALCFLKEAFSIIISSTTLLYQLEYSHLIETLKSDFTEASELNILKAVIKWGEYQNQFDEKEPNSSTFHSLGRKTAKKKDIDDGKLRKLISELIDLVRIGHILPIDSEYLTSVAKRGLINTLPPFMICDDNSLPINRGLTAWFRNRTNESFQRPRFFTPYFEECKFILEQRLGYPLSIDDNASSSSTSTITDIDIKKSVHIPDTLYMIDKSNFMTGCASIVSDGDLVSPMGDFHFCFTSSSSSSVPCYEHIGKPRLNLPMVEERIRLLMKQREQELKTSPLCLRALKISYDRCEALKLVQLRVVREFGLPDIASEVLHSKQTTAVQENSIDPDENVQPEVYSNKMNQMEDEMPPPPPRPAAGFIIPSNQVCDPFSYDSELKLESSSRYELESQFSSTASHRTLNEMVPDIAMATKNLRI